ncbi:hypothetical protein EIP91_000870 [Steccherinum ochraceum]|uniref:separase n=1 Tax=Steccherinum ochraceum TaxID=92696 RepID=A0A4R0RU11_9APHY|nr:hypothetical protein EIP91_000870 [Steccherinum ochraceum]
MPPRRTTTSRNASTAIPTASSRTTSRTKTATPSAVDALASTLASNLTLSDKSSKGKQKVAASPPDPEEQCLAAMRAVNASSKRLSGIVAGGWKPYDNEKRKKGGLSVEDVRKLVDEVAGDLRFLREMKAGSLDIERAASSIIGKILSLEMYDAALPCVMDMHDALARLYCPSFNRPPETGGDYFLTLPPLADGDPPPSEIVISLICSYFVHALSTFCAALGISPPLPHSLSVNEFGRLVQAGLAPGSFRNWLPFFASDPSRGKIADSACTKIYTIFTKTCSALISLPSPPRSTANASPSAVFRMRVFSLSCLAQTSPGTIEADAFWGEVGKVVAEYKDDKAEPRHGLVLSSITSLVDVVEMRSDKGTYLDPQGKRFRQVLDGWLSIAKTANDHSSLDRISRLLSSSTTIVTSHESNSSGSSQPNQSLTVEAMRLCALLSKLEAALSRDASQSTEGADVPGTDIDALDECSSFLTLALQNSEGEAGPEKQIVDKVYRAFDRVRRVAIRVIEAHQATPAGDRRPAEDATQSLQRCSEALGTALTASKGQATSSGGQSMLLSWLDTLYVLAKSTLVLQMPDTFDAAYAWLDRGLIFFSDEPHPLYANHLRILGGAFYNLSGILYRSGRYAFAIRFMERGCALGTRALDCRKRQHSAGETPETDRDRESWIALEEGLYKRWELLGVCHAKIGDRKPAYDAFLQAIKSYPFFKSSFVDVARRTPAALLFSSFPAASETLPSSSPFHPAAVTQLGILVDRITYMGTCELLLEPREISLRSSFNFQDDTTRIIVGALLERQVQSLESSRYKSTVKKTMSALLGDALDSYPLEGNMPLRRSGVWLKWLEGSYFGGEEFDGIQVNAEGICQEVTQLLSREIISPKQIVAPAKKAMGRSTTRVKTTAKKSVKISVLPPVTPKPRRGLLASSSADILTHSSSHAQLSSIPLNGFAKLCDLLHMVSQLLGLLGHVVIKIHILNVTRKLCERYPDGKPEDFVQISLDLGHEYAMLGKTERAANIYASVRHHLTTDIPDELKALYYLRYAELLGTIGNVLKGSSTYCEATGLLERLESEDERTMTTVDRVNRRVTTLERVAVAATSFAALQYSKDDPTASLNGLLQALRLYHRAIDTFTRLAPPPKSSALDNPFDMSDMKDALSAAKTNSPGSHQSPVPDNPPRKTYARRNTLSSLEWRIATGLLSTLFALGQAYLSRGSVREAEYFVLQAKDLAESLNASAMICRALTRLGELKLCMGKVDEAHECLRNAADLVEDGVGGVDAADLRRLKGELTVKVHGEGDNHARKSYEEAMKMLEDLDELLVAHDNSIIGNRRSSAVSPRSSLSPQHDSLMPSLVVSVLRKNIALLHGAGEEYSALLDRLRTLPTNAETKAEESSLFAKLTLDDAYARFKADMLLGSLAESTITLPMGMTGERMTASATTQDILSTLSAAEKLFWSDLALVARRGKVSHVRDAVVSLALIKAFQTSLGQSKRTGTFLTARLLDSSAAITIRREMLEVIQHKFVDALAQDDMQWPLITANGSVMSPLAKSVSAKSRQMLRRQSGSPTPGSSSLTDDDSPRVEDSSKAYWDFIASRYKAQLYEPSTLRASQTSFLPPHWTVISVTLTSDQKSLFVTRQRRANEPLIFCIPLKGRRESEEDDEDDEVESRPLTEGGQMGYMEVLQELNEVVRLSDEGTRGASKVDKDDKHARAKWWKDRRDLDKRLQTLLENIEFCWLGAFKTIFSEPSAIPPSVLSSFRSRLESIFVRTLLPPAPGPPPSRPKHKAKSSSSGKNAVRLAVTLSDALLETFANLSPTAPAEELEDLAYFILDLYAFHGGPQMGVVVAEVDMDQLVIDLRGALEEVSAGRQKHIDKLEKSGKFDDGDYHTFLVLDKNVQSIPWECIPILRGRSVSRIPSMEFLIDRILYAKHERGLPLTNGTPISASSTPERVIDDDEDEEADQLPGSDLTGDTIVDRITVDPRNTLVILNPSGDLKNTEGRFVDWVAQMQQAIGWQAIIGRKPSENEMVNALETKDLVIYFGHGGAEQYIRSHKIRHLQRCAATMLWGCSSGTLRDMGEFDRVGTPLNYVMAGCPTLVANLWDVTDRDIDKFSQEVFDKIHLAEVDEVRSWQSTRSALPGEKGASGGTKPVSIVRAIAQSRGVCKLQYLTGAAPVVYGIPFYL